MDPCKRCLVVAACQSNCENRINYVKRRVKLIDTSVVGVALTLILLMLISIGMNVYIGMSDNIEIKIVWALDEVTSKMGVLWTTVAISFFIFLKMPLESYRRKLKKLIGDA